MYTKLHVNIILKTKLKLLNWKKWMTDKDKQCIPEIFLKLYILRFVYYYLLNLLYSTCMNIWSTDVTRHALNSDYNIVTYYSLCIE